MTHQQLLIPRWLVLGDWPGREFNKYNIGDIITEATSPMELPRDQNGNLKWKLEWEKYPQLFKRLWWWELHKPEQLTTAVKFIKDTNTNVVYQVYKFDIAIAMEGFFADEKCQWSSFIFLRGFHLPTTEEVYQNYLASK